MNIASLLVFTLSLGYGAQAAAATKNSKRKLVQPEEKAPEMRIDPNLVQTYQTGVSAESERVETQGVQYVAVEPSIDFHQFRTFEAHNDYFEIPLNGGSKNTVAPSIWIGHPTGAVWGSMVRARAGLDLSYLSSDGGQSIHHRELNSDFKDNVAAQVLPVFATLRLTNASSSIMSYQGMSPWLSLGAGMMLTQVSGTLDGVSQTAWTPVTKVGTGVRYLLPNTKGFFGGLNAGVFSVAASSQKAVWRGTGVTIGADVVL